MTTVPLLYCISVNNLGYAAIFKVFLYRLLQRIMPHIQHSSWMDDILRPKIICSNYRALKQKNIPLRGMPLVMRPWTDKCCKEPC
jgi:hypothetical protein